MGVVIHGVHRKDACEEVKREGPFDEIEVLQTKKIVLHERTHNCLVQAYSRYEQC